MTDEQFEFVAIDFEHATNHKGSICSVGIATFRDGKIVDEYYTLVKPPNNKYSPYTIAKHKITPEETKSARTFGEIYHEIRQRIYGKTLVAHGAFNTDRHCLEQAMAHEKIEDDLKIEWKCTLTLVNVPLDLACSEIGIELDHHHALSDAIACGLVYGAFLRGDIDMARMELARLNQGPKAINHGSYPAKITGQVLRPDFESATNRENPFFMKKVVLTGFSDSLKEKLAIELKDLGADLDTGVSKKTNYLIIGDNPGPSKISKMKSNIEDGKEARIINYEEYQGMVNGS